MPRRTSTLLNSASIDVTREIGSKYDVVKTVAENIDAIVALAATEPEVLVTLLNEATNFTGLTVVAGEEAGWNPSTKVLTVPTMKGDKGDPGTDGLNGNNGLTPIYYFYVDSLGNLVYDVTYNQVDSSELVKEW